MNTENEITDELVEKAKRGDSHARSRLFELVRPILKRKAQSCPTNDLTRKLDDSDIVQLSFVSILKSFPDFRGSTAAEFVSWALSIVDNQSKMQIRKYRSGKRAIGLEISARSKDFGSPARASTPSGEIIRNELRLCVLDALSNDHRPVYALFLNGMTCKEIAESMDRPEGTVKSIVTRALKKTRSFWEQMNSSRDSNNDE